MLGNNIKNHFSCNLQICKVSGYLKLRSILLTNMKHYPSVMYHNSPGIQVSVSLWFLWHMVPVWVGHSLDSQREEEGSPTAVSCSPHHDLPLNDLGLTTSWTYLKHIKPHRYNVYQQINCFWPASARNTFAFWAQWNARTRTNYYSNWLCIFKICYSIYSKKNIFQSKREGEGNSLTK